MRVIHPIPPLYDSAARVLILGSFPSVKSREQAFFYGHPQNRFWRVLATVLGTAPPETVEQKKAFILGHHIALWDVIAECDIVGSSDSSIQNVVPNDIGKILRETEICAVFVNGKTAERYYIRYTEQKTGQKAICLPSTSPANAAWSVERLAEKWSIITSYL